MRFLETLLIVFAAIYVAQLVIMSLILATFILFLWCLYKRPREALVLGVGVLLAVFITKPIGVALVAAIALGFICWALDRSIKARRGRGTSCPVDFLPKL